MFASSRGLDLARPGWAAAVGLEMQFRLRRIGRLASRKGPSRGDRRVEIQFRREQEWMAGANSVLTLARCDTALGFGWFARLAVRPGMRVPRRRRTT